MLFYACTLAAYNVAVFSSWTGLAWVTFIAQRLGQASGCTCAPACMQRQKSDLRSDGFYFCSSEEHSPSLSLANANEDGDGRKSPRIYNRLDVERLNAGLRARFFTLRHSRQWTAPECWRCFPRSAKYRLDRLTLGSKGQLLRSSRFSH
jgi:hypothetical protein